MKDLTIIKSNIKGYHHFKVRPHEDIEMDVELDVDNSYDPSAMSVSMPKLDCIPLYLHEVVTREERGRDKEQRVRDTAGRQVGRVPANLCKLFRKLLKNGEVIRVVCHSKSLPCLSEVPESQQKYRRNHFGKDKDRRGGGAVIPCCYVLKCRDQSYNKVKEFMHAALKRGDFQSTEEVLLENEPSHSCPF